MAMLSSIFQTPTAFRFADTATNALIPRMPGIVSDTAANGTITTLGELPDHPPMSELLLLVFEAVLEVVCVSLPGYILARQGLFDVASQKFVANLNITLFTPCLIFTKLASQLSIDKLADLAVIPVIFVIMTAVSYFCSVLLCKVFRFGKRARNFVIAMGVFGNSNSLPISLVLSLAMTISGLHWDRIPGDNDDDVAARGILYLLIFQQLGQMVRWSWGYHVLLAPRRDGEERDDGTMPTPRVEYSYRDFAADDSELSSDDIEAQSGPDPFESPHLDRSYVGLHRAMTEHTALLTADTPVPKYLGPQTHTSQSSTAVDSDSHTVASLLSSPAGSIKSSRPPSIRIKNHHLTLPDNTITSLRNDSMENRSVWFRAWTKVKGGVVRFAMGLWEFMNPPLWAMLIALIVASVPALQRLFFTEGTFIQNSVTRAVSQSGNVAVPLILVVLGANLANSTSNEVRTEHHVKHENRLIIASLLARMVLPYIIMAPLLALAAKYANISLLDDPIFLIVCFLLVGAPSALQLAQICQVNNVFESAMSKILFWSYVIMTFPSTLVLVVTAIEVVHWAA